jgi:Raf kinase inhibitor-like YbhB/YbcL family protein
MSPRTLENEAMNRSVVIAAIAFASLCLSVFGTKPGGPGAKPVSFQVSTPAFPSEGTIPKQYTCDGADGSPALSWSGAPADTKSFALIADDPDAPAGTWTHWVIWNIPPTQHQLAAGISKDPRLPNGIRQGVNDFHKPGYNGPCPPPGNPHRYYFKLFALDSDLQLRPGADRKELEYAMKPHIVAKAELMGRYGR